LTRAPAVIYSDCINKKSVIIDGLFVIRPLAKVSLK